MSIEQHYVAAFGQNLMHVPQERRARLLDTVDSDINFTEKGEFFTDEQLGESEPEDVQERFGDSPTGQVNRERRGAFFQGFHDGKMLDTADVARQLVDPANPIVQAMQFGMQRKRNRAIMDGLLGAARQGKQLENSVALPNSQIINTTGGLTIAKLRAASLLLDESEVDAEEGANERYWIGAAADKDSLLATTEVTSTDYNTVKALVDGKVDTYMGFKFVWFASKHIARTSTNRRRNIAYIKRAGVYRARPLVGGPNGNVKIAERADKQFNWYAYYKSEHGFMRRFDSGVVEVQNG
jgi:hypothetical protein